MGRKNKKCSKTKPARPSGTAPPPTNADWEDSTAAFRKEALRCRSDDGAAARLANRHPASPLAHHVLGHARASAARAGDAVAPLRRAAELAPRCPGIAATLASALLYARRPHEALAECARALAVDDPTDPALHAACSRGGLTASTPQARVAAARERLLGVRADAEALAAAASGAGDAAAAPLPPLVPPCCCRHATGRGAAAMISDDLQGLLTVSVADLTAHCVRISGGARGLVGAVEFAKATNAWAYWLCPVCDKVFLDADSFTSHVEGEYLDELQELQPLMPKRAAVDANELHISLRWTPFEIGGEDPDRRKDLDKIRDAFSSLCTFKALPAGLVDKLIKYARSRSKRPLPYCIPSCVTYLDDRELKRLLETLDQFCEHSYRNWEFIMGLGNQGKSKARSDVISLVQDGSVLCLDAEEIASRSGECSSEVDMVTRFLFSTKLHEESVTSWNSLRQKCVHRGNEILKRIYELSDILLKRSNLKYAPKERVHKGYFLTEADSIDVEMLLLNNEVDYLKKKLAEVCTFDYTAVVLPLIRAYIWDKLNNNTPGEDLEDGDDKDAADNGDGSGVLLDVSFLNDKIPDTDSYVYCEICGTEEFENSSLSLSDSSNSSTLETESASIDSEVGSIPHISSVEPHVLNVILRALWHLRQFHDRFLAVPLVLPHFTVEVHCIICLLRKLFNAWDNAKDNRVNTFSSDARTAFSDILNKRNICVKAGTNIASEVISAIFEMLHDSHKSLHPNSEILEYRGISTSRRSLDFVCLPHNVFGLPIREQKKCKCPKESCEEKEYTTFFYSIDVSAIQTNEIKSLGQLMRDGDTQFQYGAKTCQCGNKIERSIQSAPPIFATVFCWPVDKEIHLNMSELLINIDTPLQFDVLYEVMREDYTLTTAVFCVEDEHLCFARQGEKWIIYGSKRVEFADTWEILRNRYRHRSLRPQILFFSRVRLEYP